jgi:hypothetical protein
MSERSYDQRMGEGARTAVAAAALPSVINVGTPSPSKPSRYLAFSRSRRRRPCASPTTVLALREIRRTPERKPSGVGV